MSIPLTNGSHSGFFDRLGKILQGLDDVNALRGGAATSDVLSAANWPARVATLEGYYAAGTSLRQVIDGFYTKLAAWQNANGQIFKDVQQAAQNTLLAMYNIDQGVSPNAPAATLIAGSLSTALVTLATQMLASGDSLQSSVPTLGAQTAVGSPAGNPVFVGSLKDPQGRTLQYCFPETITLTCTQDASNGADAGSEPFLLTGQPAVSDYFSQLWPGGSGTSLALDLVDGSQSNAAGNLLTNSDWENFSTANYPDNWVDAVGVAGTTIFNGGSGNAYASGGGSLQFTGDSGGTLIEAQQTFNRATSTSPAAGGTPGQLAKDTQYAWNGWIKCSATPSAGVARVRLLDGTGAVINDDAGNANSSTRTLTSVSTSWVNVNGTFRTPVVLPSSQKFSVGLSTAIDSGKSVYFSRFAMTPMTPAYTNGSGLGPSFAGFSGSSNVADVPTPDQWTFAVGQTWGAFQRWLFRLWLNSVAGVYFNNSGSPTVADSLII